MHMIEPRPAFRPVTERDAVPERGIDFTLTPAERDAAKLGTLALEDRRRRLNEADKGEPCPSP